MQISLVVAYGLDFSIGLRGDLPWRLPADLAYFRRLTTGHTVLMGRKTFDSIGKPLPNRRNIVLSRQAPMLDYIDGTKDLIQTDSLPAVLAFLRAVRCAELFVIGGAEIYALLLPHATRVYATLVRANFPAADTFFPPLDAAQWRCASAEFRPQDEKNAYDMEFQVWERV